MTNPKNFIKQVETLINPIDVGTMHFIFEFNKLLPKRIQNTLMKSSVKKYPYMGFVVEPYSYFLCYEITDTELAQSLLPNGFKLIKTKIFKEDEPKNYVIFGCVNAHTSAFWGTRMEFYIIAEDQKTGLLSWVIIDYDSNTIGYDKKNGLKAPTATKSVLTTNYEGYVIADIQNAKTGNELSFESNTLDGKMQSLDQRLWLEGNLSICYGKTLSKGKPEPFSLKFEPKEVEKALNIPIGSIKIHKNNWYPGLFNNTPEKLVCFPYAQHYISDSPGHTSFIQNKEQLEQELNMLDFSKISAFSTKSFKTLMFVGMGISALISLILIILLIIK